MVAPLIPGAAQISSPITLRPTDTNPASTDYDVVVAGAGAAGSAAARDIAASGYRVLLVENHRFVGEPLHCSGLVSPRTLKLAALGSEIVRNEILGARVHLASGKNATFAGDRTHAFVIDRVAFDRALAARAEDAGAALSLGTKLVTIGREADHLRLVLLRDGRESSITTRLLVGADGAQSSVAQWIGAPVSKDRVIGVSTDASVNLPGHEVQIFIGGTVAPGFFAWAIPVGDGTARVGVASKGTRSSREYLERLRDLFPHIVGDAELRPVYGGVIPLAPTERPFADNVMLIGDAAGQVKPTSGGGIHAALVGAQHCAATAIHALGAGDLSAAALASYAKAWRGELGAEFDRMTELRRLFLSLDDHQIDKLISLLSVPLLRRIVEQHGDIDFPSRAVEELMARPSVLALLRMVLKLPVERLAAHVTMPDSPRSGARQATNFSAG